jgi:methanogenic corrinoid protein MtbC1
MDTSPTFNPSAFADVPLYNIQAVAAATGVPAITLRSWERRYGIPHPKRDPKGYRLYSDRDIAVTRWLKDRVQRGVGISRAVNMLRVIEAGVATAQPESHPFDVETLRRRLLDSMQRLDEQDVSRVVAEGLTVMPVEDLALQVLQPVLEEVGDLWSSGELSVTIEHVGSNLIRAHLSQLFRISPPPIRSDQVMVACAPGELHDMGALSVALFLRRRGFDVIYVGASIAPDDFIADVQSVSPAAVCISLSRREGLSDLRDLLERLQRVYSGTVLYGGRIFRDDAALQAGVPGMYGGSDAEAAVRSLEAALNSSTSAVTPAGA